MMDDELGISILGIGTAVPNHRLDQTDTSQRLYEALQEFPDSARWAKKIFKQCGVESRYTCEPNLLASGEECRYFSRIANPQAPSTAERMKTYKQEAVPLGMKAAKQAIQDARVDAADITHLITVSCTGQFLPGMDASLIRLLGLSDTVNRIPLNFLGCAAGLKAICLSRQIVSGNPSAKVLIVCIELCTLHIQPSSQREALFSASFFGDGASACLVGASGSKQQGIFQLREELSVLLPDSTQEMLWEVGNFGFDLYLSTDIPKLLGRFVPEQMERLFGGEPMPELWAIHPGGKGIIDTMEKMFDLAPEQTSYSRQVLRNYGNMSSATILFVLNAIRLELESSGSGPAEGVSLAFGPGLTCEIIKFSYKPSIPSLDRHSDALYV
ncbi:type III polyketide synthase [Paenibacillus vulneris]